MFTPSVQIKEIGISESPLSEQKLQSPLKYMPTRLANKARLIENSSSIAWNYGRNESIEKGPIIVSEAMNITKPLIGGWDVLFI